MASISYVLQIVPPNSVDMRAFESLLDAFRQQVNNLLDQYQWSGCHGTRIRYRQIDLVSRQMLEGWNRRQPFLSSPQASLFTQKQQEQLNLRVIGTPLREEGKPSGVCTSLVKRKRVDVYTDYFCGPPAGLNAEGPGFNTAEDAIELQGDIRPRKRCKSGNWPSAANEAQKVILTPHREITPPATPPSQSKSEIHPGVPTEPITSSDSVASFSAERRSHVQEWLHLLDEHAPLDFEFPATKTANEWQRLEEQAHSRPMGWSYFGCFSAIRGPRQA